MQTTKSALAIGLAAIVVSTSLATAGTLPLVTGPVTRPDHPAIERDNSRPFPELGDDRVVIDGPILKVSPYRVSCDVRPNAFNNGAAAITFKNTGSETIPAGSIITVVYSDGTKAYLKVNEDIKPGGAIDVMGPLMANEDGFSCSATVKAPKAGPADPKLGN